MLFLQVVTHRWFEQLMLVLIIASSILLVFDTPGLDSSTPLYRALRALDIFFTVAFGIEAVMKIMVVGLIFNGPGSYLRSPWNVLDLAVVVIGECLMHAVFDRLQAEMHVHE